MDGFDVFWQRKSRRVTAVLVGFVQVRHGQSWSDGYGAFRLGRVRFDWLRSGKAVMAWKGYFRHGLSWHGG
jgi:hypothetical protein